MSKGVPGPTTATGIRGDWLEEVLDRGSTPLPAGWKRRQ